MTETITKSNYVFSFEEGDGKNKMLLGGKGANLCEMTQLGIAVPPGFTITTECCLAYLKQQQFPKGLMNEVKAQIAALEEKTGKKFGAGGNPLLVSVRSGSAMSMPGMMDTILNLGLNHTTLRGLIEATDNPRFGYDSFRRFVQLFGKVALDVPDELFDDAMDSLKERRGVTADLDLTAKDLQELGETFIGLVQKHTGRPFPEDVTEQLEIAIAAVFRSWQGKRAIDYRRQFKITPDMANGTAVNVCTMVFGNMGNDSATGVGFTRNPGTGENLIYGEYLVNAQGEDVVAGVRTPKAIADMEQEMPGIYGELQELRNRLETHYHAVQDFEFTIERGTLYCLQTRNGKMNARATVITAVEMVGEGILSKEDALLGINPMLLEQLLVPQLDEDHGQKPIGTGLAASPGAASGRIYFDADTAEEHGKAGEPVVLVREETKPEDIHGFFASEAILTSRGGKTSHAAVVARGMGKPCVSACEGMAVDVHARVAKIGDAELHEGDVVTIDGSTGDVYLGRIPTVDAEFFEEFSTMLGWADEMARLKVYANADTPGDAQRARSLGAQGIGLCRTERMFNAVDRLPIVQDMILAESDSERHAALDKLLPIQREDFAGIFRAMDGLPVTIRLLDPPIHEFLPTAEQLEFEIRHLKDLQRSIRNMGELPDTLKLIDPMLHKKFVDNLDDLHGSLSSYQNSQRVASLLERKQAMLRKVHVLHEVNPMLGHRGVRLGITFPEIYTMQIRAILEATADCLQEGVDVKPWIMVPQVCTIEELDNVRAMLTQIQPEVESRRRLKLNIKFGTMIEVVRACMRAASLAKTAEFFSFGTNDLTQAAFSFSREDAENKFLPQYTEAGILRDNPFEVLDVQGVGRLMKLAVDWGRETRPGMSIGICGEHGGHPASASFCHWIGLDYVSCSGPRVPIARLAAAQAKLRESHYGDHVFA